ncbi:MAG TPA: T9SS type A sorting domain-containing protein [Bacteroides sp.]|nr:T9SS type A sorting domain-containing protein [Bacteroides sp.]
MEAIVSDGDASVKIEWIVEVRAMPTSRVNVWNNADRSGFIEIFPNPFTQLVRINYFLPDHAKISIDIYSTNGKKIKSLYSGDQPEGYNTLSWNGTDQKGAKINAGVYICRFVFNNADGIFIQERKIIFIPVG